MDNMFIERLWRSVKHADIYLREYGSLSALDAWFERYNAWRLHDALGNRTPSEAHAAAETPASTPAKEELAA
jgi:putative transposase